MIVESTDLTAPSGVLPHVYIRVLVTKTPATVPALTVFMVSTVLNCAPRRAKALDVTSLMGNATNARKGTGATTALKTANQVVQLVGYVVRAMGIVTATLGTMGLVAVLSVPDV